MAIRLLHSPVLLESGILRNPALRLPFGNNRASVYASDAEFAAALRLLKRPVADFWFSGGGHRAAATGVHIGDLDITAAYSEPMHTKCLVEPQLSFLLPVTGSGKIVNGSQFVEWAARKLIISNSFDRPVEVFAKSNSIVTLRPSPDRLQAALENSLRDRDGPDATGAKDIMERLLTRGPFIDPGRSWTVDYYASLMNVVAIIDGCSCDEGLLTRIGVEDVVNRLLAELVLDQEKHAASEYAADVLPRSVRAVDLICDHIRSSVGSPLTISQMEDITGLTGRALSYAFRSRFDCSPQEWQRNFLLDHARPLLMNPDYTGSVKAIAFELGFSSPISFANFYRKRFGELPSETLTRATRARVAPLPQE